MTVGRWSKTLPGLRPLSAELGVDPKTVQAALGQLEREGVLESAGPRRSRRITLTERRRSSSLRIGIMLFEPPDRQLSYIVDLKHRLLAAGHSPHFVCKSLTELGMDPTRLPRVIRRSEADAWMILAGSREILQWFEKLNSPAFGILGGMRRRAVAGSGPDKIPAYLAAARRLTALGHRRIVYLTRSPLSFDDPGRPVGAFLGELKAAGIPTGPYNLPNWENSPGGLRRCLDTLFAATPPTALLIDAVELVTATLQHLSRRGIHAPEQVSLICTDPDPAFKWCEPTIAHVRWDMDPIIRRAVRWADQVARGKDDRRKSLFKAHFIDGGTVGPAPR